MVKKTVTLSELLFWIAYIPYVSILLLELSLYKNIVLINAIVKIIRYGCYVILGVKFFTDISYKRKNIIYAFLLCILLGMSAIFSGDKQMFCLLLFIGATHNIEFEKIVKVSLIIHIFIMSAVFMGCFMGILDNRIFEEGIRIRYSLGYSYTTTSANLFMHIILMWIFVRKNSMKFIESIVLLIINGILYYFTDTKSAFMFGTFAIFCGMFFKANICRKLYLKLIPFFKSLIPVCVVITSIAMIFYDENLSFWNKINTMLNGRIQLTHRAFIKYGCHLFGSPIQWVGNTKYETGINALREYNYVDSSYAQIALKFGIVFLIIVCIYYSILLNQSMQKKDYYLGTCIMVIVIHSLLDPQLMMLAFHPFMLGLGYIVEHSKFDINSTM